MNRALVITASLIFTLLIAIAGGVLVAPSFIDWNDYKAQAQEQIKKVAGYDVAFNGNVSLGIFPSPHVSLKDVVVKSPAGFASDKLASFDALDVRVKMAPLFSGKVEVTSLKLVKPVISLEQKADGSQNWMTPELKAMSGDPKAGQDGSAAKDQKSQAAAVALQAVTIEEGALQYKSGKGEPLALSDINVDLSADTLKGPFAIKGDFKGFEQSFTLDTKIDAFEAADDPLSIVLNGSAQPADVKLAYKGVIEPSTQSAQGTADVAFKNGTIKAFVTADSKSVDLKDMDLKAMGYVVKGNFNSTLNPVKFKGKLNVDGVDAAVSGAYDEVLSLALVADEINLDEMMKKMPVGSAAPIAADKEPSSVGSSGNNAGRGSASMDVNFDANLGRLIYQGKTFKNVQALGALRKNSLMLQNFSVGDAGSASVKAKGTLGDTRSLSGLDLDISLSVSDLKAFGAFSEIEISGLPKQVNALSADLDLKGNMDVLETSATIKALEGSATFSGPVKNVQKKPAFDSMNVHLQHPNFNKAMQIFAPAAPQYASWAKPLDFKAAVAMKDNVINLNDIKAQVAGGQLSGAMKIDNSGSKPAVSGTLSFGDLVMKSSASTAPAGGAPAGGSSRSGAERWSSAAIDSSWLNGMDLNLDIKANSLIYETWDLKSPEVDFVMQGGALNIKNLKAGLYGGSLQMASVIKPANDNFQGMAIDADVKFSDVDLENLAGSFIGSKIIKASGKADLATKVRGIGVSQKSIISSLSGDGMINGRTIVMEGFDLARFARAMSIDNKPGDTAVGLWKTSTKGGTTAFDTMDGAFTISNGIIAISRLDMKGPEAALVTSGKVDLPQWSVATKHTITLQGEDVPPPFSVDISGSLDNPASTFGQGAVQSYLQQKLERKLGKYAAEKLGLPAGDEPVEQKLLNKFLNKKLGIPEPVAQPAVNDNAPQSDVAPAGGSEAEPFGDNWSDPAAAPFPAQETSPPPAAAPAAQEEPAKAQEPEEAIKGIIQDLIRQ